jgi:hypothetical protein
LQLASEELQADIGGAQLLGERRELDAAAEALVLVSMSGTILSVPPDGCPGTADAGSVVAVPAGSAMARSTRTPARMSGIAAEAVAAFPVSR